MLTPHAASHVDKSFARAYARYTEHRLSLPLVQITARLPEKRWFKKKRSDADIENEGTVHRMSFQVATSALKPQAAHSKGRHLTDA